MTVFDQKILVWIGIGSGFKEYGFETLNIYIVLYYEESYYY
jgi:hypothetical protein